MYISSLDVFLYTRAPHLMLSPNIHPGLFRIFCGLNFHQQAGRRAALADQRPDCRHSIPPRLWLHRPHRPAPSSVHTREKIICEG